MCWSVCFQWQQKAYAPGWNRSLTFRTTGSLFKGASSNINCHLVTDMFPPRSPCRVKVTNQPPTSWFLLNLVYEQLAVVQYNNKASLCRAWTWRMFVRALCLHRFCVALPPPLFLIMCGLTRYLPCSSSLYWQNAVRAAPREATRSLNNTLVDGINRFFVCVHAKRVSHMTLLHVTLWTTWPSFCGLLCLSLLAKKKKKGKSEPNPSFGCVCTGDCALILPFPSIRVQSSLSSWILEARRHWMSYFNLGNGDLMMAICPDLYVLVSN